MKSPSSEEYQSPREAGRTAIEYVRDAFIGGLAVVIPFVVTVVVLVTIVQYLVRYLTAVVGVAPTGDGGADPVTLGIALALLLALILFVGFVTQFRYGETFIDYVDATLTRIPGFGAIYESFREMSDVMMESDQRSFRDVKLVEFPHEGAYTLGFLTADSAPELKAAADRNDLVTLFLPLAPNPVMGGHLVHVPADRVMDVDMSVDEGIRTVATSGVATGGQNDAGADGASLSADELERIGAIPETAVGGNAAPEYVDGNREQGAADRSTRTDAYEEYAEPDSADEEPVPSAVESYGDDDDTLGNAQETPEAMESTDANTLGNEQETPADVAADGPDADERGGDAASAGGRWRDESRSDERTEGLTDDEDDDRSE